MDLLSEKPINPFDLDWSPTPLSRAKSSLLIATIAGIFVVDLCTAGLNLPILYTIPLAILVSATRTRHIYQLSIILVVFTYLGYFVGPRSSEDRSFEAQLHSFRMLNRSLVAAAILAFTLIPYLWNRIRNRVLASGSVKYLSRDEQQIYVQILLRLNSLLVALVASVMTVFIILIEVITPQPFNLPILYSAPLLVCSRGTSRKLIWWGLVILLLLTYLGMFWGPSDSLTNEWTSLVNLLRGRTIAAVALIGIAISADMNVAKRQRAI